MSKHKQILQHLMVNGSITGLEAWTTFGVYRLSSVINRLRSAGYNITTIMCEGENGETYARYVMEH